MSGNPNRHEDRTSTVAMLKSRISVADVLSALMLASDLGDLCPDPHCERVALVRTKDGQGWRCTECGATGDIFTLVMLKHDKDFPAARRWVEGNVLPSRRDETTPDLFAPRYRPCKESTGKRAQVRGRQHSDESGVR